MGNGHTIVALSSPLHAVLALILGLVFGYALGSRSCDVLHTAVPDLDPRDCCRCASEAALTNAATAPSIAAFAPSARAPAAAPLAARVAPPPAAAPTAPSAAPTQHTNLSTEHSCSPESDLFCYPKGDLGPDWRRNAKDQDPHEYPPWTSTGQVGNVVVGVVTDGARQDKIIPVVMDTWGGDFAHIHYVSATDSPGLITKVVPRNNTMKSYETLHMLKFLHEEHPEAPWYFKCDDDSYINAPRLAALTAQYNSSEPWYFGQVGRHVGGVVFCSGGGGYFISNALMKIIYPNLLRSTKGFRQNASDIWLGEIVKDSTKGAVECKDPNEQPLVFHHESLFDSSTEIPYGTPYGGLYFYGGLPYKGPFGFYENRDRALIPLAASLYSSYSWHYVRGRSQYLYRMLYTLLYTCSTYGQGCLNGKGHVLDATKIGKRAGFVVSGEF